MRNPALRRVELAFLLFSAVEFGAWVAILLYAYEAIGPASVGIVAAVQLLPGALIVPFIAGLVDRFSRQRVLFIGYVGQVVTFGVTFIGMAVDAPPLVVVLAATCATTAQSITRPTHGALVPSLALTPEELTAANGWSGAMEGTGMLAGPLIAAAILAVAAPAAVFGAATAASVLTALLTARLPRAVATGASAAGPDDERGRLLDGIRLVARHRSTRIVVGILTLRMVVIGALDVLFVLLALEVFDIGESGAGLLTAAIGLGVILGGGLTFAFIGRQSLARILAIAGSTSGLALVAVGSGVSVLAAAALIVATGVGFAVCDVIARTILQRVTPDLVLGRVLGAVEGLAFAGLASGAILAPVCALFVGVQGAVTIVGLLLPVGIALSWVELRAMDRSVLLPTRAIGLLRDAVIFAPLPLPQLEWLARQARWHTVEPGQVLIREGDEGDAYHVLETGSLAVSQAGRQLRVCDARADGVGEIALLRDVPRTATVTALAMSVLLLIRRRAFLEVVAGHPPTREVADRVATVRSEVDPAS